MHLSTLSHFRIPLHEFCYFPVDLTGGNLDQSLLRISENGESRDTKTPPYHKPLRFWTPSGPLLFCRAAQVLQASASYLPTSFAGTPCTTIADEARRLPSRRSFRGTRAFSCTLLGGIRGVRAGASCGVAGTFRPTLPADPKSFFQRQDGAVTDVLRLRSFRDALASSVRKEHSSESGNGEQSRVPGRCVASFRKILVRVDLTDRLQAFQWPSLQRLTCSAASGIDMRLGQTSWEDFRVSFDAALDSSTCSLRRQPVARRHSEGGGDGLNGL